MKKILNIFVLSLMVAFTLVSCDKDIPGAGGADGKVSLKKLAVKTLNAEVVIDDNKSRAASELDNFIVKIIDKSTNEVTNTWKYSEMPEIATLKVGSYKVSVENEEVQSAAWDSPYFKGSQDFTIKANDITEVDTVVCKLSNLKVSIKYSNELKTAIGEGKDVKVNVKVGENSALDFAYGETRSGYFKCDEGNKTLVATFSGTVDGYYISEYKVLSNVESGQHRIITFSLKTDPDIPGQLGQIGTTGMSLDATVVNVDCDADVPTEEEIIEPDDYISLSSSTLSMPSASGSKTLTVSSSGDWTATSNASWCTVSPASGAKGTGSVTISASENTSTDARTANVTFTMGNVVKTLAVTQAGFSSVSVPVITSTSIDLNGVNVVTSSSKVDVDIDAQAGIKNLIVTIISETLTKELLEDVGLTNEFDLCNPGQYETGLKSLELPIGDEVRNKTQLNFDISGFMQFLTIYQGIHQFKITVVDNNDNSTVAILKLEVK